MPETEYVSALREGDHQALKLCYDEYYRSLLISLLNRQVPLEDAQELIHDAFVKLWKLRNIIQNKQHVKALLYQSLKWGLRDFIRRNNTKNKVIDGNILIEHAENADSISLQYFLEVEEYINLVFMAINSLPPYLARVILLRGEGYAVAEISELLRISHKNVRNTIYEARQRLGKIIPDRWLRE